MTPDLPPSARVPRSATSATVDPPLLTSLTTVEELLDRHAAELGRDLVAYRHHVYRVVNLCLGIAGDGQGEAGIEKVAVAAVFHDLGIWTHHTFDYIAPSVALARQHLTARGRADWIPEIEAMIVNHHKISSSPGSPLSLVESFRRADWIDVTLGLRTCGVPRTLVAAVNARWPGAGFHRRLVELTIDRWWRHPLSPLPMVRW